VSRSSHARDRKACALTGDPGVLHRDALVKYAAAFLRNSFSRLEGKAELPRAPL
jgi:hypothetical protein